MRKNLNETIVDSTGRCIPFVTFNGEYVNADPDTYLVQPPEIDYAAILGRFRQFFAPEMKFVSVSEFRRQATALIARISANKRVANLLNGVHLPIVLPQLKFADYGRIFEGTFLAAAERAYRAWYPNRIFTNYQKGRLEGAVGVVEESRHQQLIEKMAEGPVVLIHFPNPLQGFSIIADREMISAFPVGFALSGALDTATSIVAHTETLTTNAYTPGLDCSANCLRSAFSLCFRAYIGGARFDAGTLIPYGRYSGGISFIG